MNTEFIQQSDTAAYQAYFQAVMLSEIYGIKQKAGLNELYMVNYMIRRTF